MERIGHAFLSDNLHKINRMPSLNFCVALPYEAYSHLHTYVARCPPPLAAPTYSTPNLTCAIHQTRKNQDLGVAPEKNKCHESGTRLDSEKTGRPGGVSSSGDLETS